MKLSLSETLKAEHYKKQIEVSCVVVGKNVSPYSIPRTIVITAVEHASCKSCDKLRGKTITIENDNPDLLKFINITSSKMFSVIKEILRIKCKFAYEVTEVQNVERIFITSKAGSKTKTDFGTYTSYFVGYGLKTNIVYNLQGYTTVDPLDQTATHIFTKATKIKSDIDSFHLTGVIKKELNEFAINKPSAEKIYDYLERLYDYYASNITRIYNRFDLHLAVDLVFKSPLSFRFGNEYIYKGWLDAMIVGDTRCGKGFVAEKLLNYFGVGEVISGDNVSYSGLVGGLQHYNGHWVVTWGKLPLNDKGLVIIDEASEIKTQDWSRLSRVRSEGIAEIVKIHTQITNARTRLLFLANPISKTVADFSYGIQAVPNIIKMPEDIARFDFVLVVAHNEVSMQEINKFKPMVTSMHSNTLEQELILWIWSKKDNDIKFSSKAVRLVYELAIKLSKTYSFTIPLIQGENIRVKLAKIAVCFAGRVYSNIEKGKILYVKEVHVECAFIFFNLIYKKVASGYYAMSQMDKSFDITYVAGFKKIKSYFNTFRNKEELCKCLLTNNNISVVDISEHLNQPKEIAREIISKLLENYCVIKKHTYYVKTPQFTEWLKKEILQK
jgi:hypothetical protein